MWRSRLSVTSPTMQLFSIHNICPEGEIRGIEPCSSPRERDCRPTAKNLAECCGGRGGRRRPHRLTFQLWCAPPPPPLLHLIAFMSSRQCAYQSEDWKWRHLTIQYENVCMWGGAVMSRSKGAGKKEHRKYKQTSHVIVVIPWFALRW